MLILSGATGSCKRMYFLYSLLLTAGAVFGAPYWLFKALRERKYFQNFRQRLGWALPELTFSARPLWIHAVSVGEVLAAKPLLTALETACPGLPVVVSTITITGHSLARQEFPRAQGTFYFPFDWDFSVERFIDRIQPRAVVLMETELWPNFLKQCDQKKIPVFLANGRLSEKSLARYRMVKKFAGSMLRLLRVIGVQTHEDRRRFLELGATEEQVRVTGNMKFDFPAPSLDDARDVLEKFRICLTLGKESPVIVVGSSMRGEEPLFLEAFKQVREAITDARLILAPRHPERFDEVAEILRQSSLPFGRRTEFDGNATESPPAILLLDTIGELRVVYSLATVAVIGGSFLPFGGHNLLEPAALGKAIVFGPEMTNFKEMARIFLHEQAARQATPGTLALALTELLQNPRARQILGHRALSTFRQNQGATTNTLNLLLPGIT